LERNLYLVEQIHEMRAPLIVALNMIDVAEQRGEEISADLLALMIGVPVLPMNAESGEGVGALVSAIDAFEPAIERRALRDPDPNPDLIPERYRKIEAICAEVISRPERRERTRSDRIDRVLTNRLVGPPIFLALMLVLFTAIFWWATPAMDLIDAGVGLLAAGVSAVLPEGFVQSLLVDGVIAGVGNVIIFLPQLVILFFALALLEGSGYMARAAFIMDRMMRRIGLSGRSFIPLLGSFACAIPGIMATRTIPSSRDRLATILVAPFMSCSARLPIYTLVTAAFFPNPLTAGLVVFSMYLLGIVAAVGTAFLIKRVIFRTEPEPFLMELPPYRIPRWRQIWMMVWVRSMDFLSRAGTIILVCTVILWALMTYPRSPEITQEFEARRAEITAQGGEDLDEVLFALAVEENGALLRHSAAGRLGRLIEPVVKPIGCDWKIGVGIIASFAAREVFVSTLGVVHSIDEETALDEPRTLAEVLRADTWPDGSPIFTPLVGITILVFFVLAMQCMSTLAVVRRETNSWKWPMIQFAYMTTIAYFAALIVYQGGRLLGLG
ncbi:ferrous iron transport protein B, partial [Candidatus Sumerlaeota bacterium]|nr:ferrous iron transport protein B [Candidatus Sumerlaeota bacterium]